MAKPTPLAPFSHAAPGIFTRTVLRKVFWKRERKERAFQQNCHHCLFRVSCSRSGRKLDPALSPKEPRNAQSASGTGLLWRQAVAMYASGAVLGPICDGQHSSHNVLHYTHPTLLQIPTMGFFLETCWWVPLLFGGAAVILGLSHPALDYLDSKMQVESGNPEEVPTWPVVLMGIALFVIQYSASGALDEPLLGVQAFGLPALDVFLCVTALLFWKIFDGTKQGLFMAILTGTAGFWTEIGLINILGLYHYTHPQFMGVPSWIPWVYFCGSPAVGNLGRRVRETLVVGSN